MYSLYMGQHFQTLMCERHVLEAARRPMWFKENCMWAWGGGGKDKGMSVKSKEHCASL